MAEMERTYIIEHERECQAMINQYVSMAGGIGAKLHLGDNLAEEQREALMNLDEYRRGPARLIRGDRD